MRVFQVLAFVPQPVKAVLLVFPLSDEMAASKKKTDEKIEQEGQPSLDPTLFFVKQTVCNLQNGGAASRPLAILSITIDRYRMHVVLSPCFTPFTM